MDLDQFRQHGHAVVDWIVDYLKTVEERPVLSAVEPGAIRAALPDAAPQEGEPFEAMLQDLDEIIMPGITHWQSPNFYAFFPANTSGPAMLGEFLSAGLGVQGMIWTTSPACTELETHMMDWLVGMLGLPEFFLSTSTGGGVIQDTASSAALCALLSAREASVAFKTNNSGVDRVFTAYTSNQAHSSIAKAMGIAGLGRDNLRLIDVDDSFALRPDALEAAIAADRAAGHHPFFVSSTVGTTSSNGMDPVRAIGDICRRESIWYHVDAAMSGTAALCPEFRHLQDGLELADSYCFNPHKWMFTNFDCDCFWVKDRSALVRTLSILPEYLRNVATESGKVIDYRDWQIPLGRRFRALKLWFVIRSFGVEGLQSRIREHVEWTKWFTEQVRASSQFALAVDAPLNLLCFHHVDGDAATEALLTTLNASGKIYATHTKLNGRYVIRISIGGTYQTFEHVKQAWALIEQTASS